MRTRPSLRATCGTSFITSSQPYLHLVCTFFNHHLLLGVVEPDHYDRLPPHLTTNRLCCPSTWEHALPFKIARRRSIRTRSTRSLKRIRRSLARSVRSCCSVRPTRSRSTCSGWLTARQGPESLV